VQLSLRPASGEQDARYFAVCTASSAPAVARYVQTTAESYAACGFGQMHAFPATQLHPTGAVVAVHDQSCDPAAAALQRGAASAPQLGLAAEQRWRASAHGGGAAGSGTAPGRGAPAAAAQDAAKDAATPQAVPGTDDPGGVQPNMGREAIDGSGSDVDVDVPFAVASGEQMPSYDAQHAKRDLPTGANAQADAAASSHDAEATGAASGQHGESCTQTAHASAPDTGDRYGLMAIAW
jgi:hypothetical protein